MITPTQMYWITRLDGFTGFGITLIAVSIIMLIIGLLFMIEFVDPEPSEIRRYLKALVCKWMLPPFIFGLSIAIFVPSTKEMAAIIMIPSIVNNEKIQQTGNKLYELASEWMEELRPSTAKKKENEK